MKKRIKKKISIKERFFVLKINVSGFFRELIFFSKFLILLFFVFWAYILQLSPKRNLNQIEKVPKKKQNFIQKGYNKIYKVILKIFDSKESGKIKSADLIFLAMKNLATKKNRTFITIGGMAIGFGAVVLLLSAGYGFERLVISKVASLSEMKQIEVSTSQGSPLSFDAEVIKQLSEIEQVDAVVPIITSVSKITYNDAVSDVVGYGVTSRFFKETGFIPVKGELFEEDSSEFNLSMERDETKGVVAGATSTIVSTTSMGQEISKIRYSIHPLEWKPVYESPDTNSTIIGYTKREMGQQEATEVCGSKYDRADETYQIVDINGKEYSYWIKDTFSIWEKKDCLTTNPDCVDGEYIVLRSDLKQSVVYGYISENKVEVQRYQITDGNALEVYTGKLVDEVSFELKKDQDTTLYMDPTQTDSKTTVLEDKRTDIHEYEGQLIYGGYYDTQDDNFVISSTGGRYSYWIKINISVWGKKDCENLCEKYYSLENEDSDTQINITVYVRAVDVIIVNVDNEALFGQVLGEQDSNVEGSDLLDIGTLAEEGDDIDWVTILEEVGVTETTDTDVKHIPADAKRIAVVNVSMLNLLGLDINEAIDESFDARFIYDSKLFDRSNYLVESEIATFKIVGAVSDSKTPTFYVPFRDIQVEGIKSVSHLKVVVIDKKDVEDVRAIIEGLGFKTNSVADTVSGINNLFDSLRLALLVLGLVALGVASLGMFNTLTVSLMEKTREVGLLKTMGLKAGEIKVLFLAESIIMSISGGLAGLLLGFLIGKLLSVLISLLALSKGQGILDIAYIPFGLGVSLVLLSSIVGVATGWYPAKRATKISALNALRYE
ncbi:MAG: ABC transporter permease [Patescibacteria group bacterium]|nr:ABC transporter permease [Patescibacteria group bacterium]